MKIDTRSTLLIASILSAAVLTACGGGGGDSPSSSTGTETAQANKVAGSTAPVSATVTPVSAVVGGAGWVSAPPVPLRERNTTPMSDSVAGASYYVDVVSGNDNNPGTLEAPWKSLKKASVAPLKAGDALLLKCGSIWRDSLEITSATAKEGGFLISGYGDCSGERRPVIRASDWVPLDNWTRTTESSAPIYARPWTGATIKRLFADGIPVLQARYPNKTANAEFALATGTGSTTQFKLRAADLQALAGRDLVGATIHVRTLLWVLDTATITAFDPTSGLVKLDKALSTSIREGAGYILEGKRWMLDAPNEWFFDNATKELVVWAPNSANPSVGAGLEAGTRDYGVNLSWVKGVKVERVRTEQQAEDGIHLMDSPESTIRDVVISHPYQMGISIGRSSQTTVKDSTIVGAGRRAIVTRDSSDIKITGNQVTDTGGFGRTDDTESAISVYGENALVSGNYIARSASVGIYFQNSLGVVIENNTIYQSCLRLGDCAGIHTWTASSSVAPVTTYTARAQVRNNVIVGAYSNAEGCANACNNQSTGIYLDEMTAGVTVSGNIISAVEIGMAIHNGQFNILDSNIVRSASFASIRAIQTRNLAAAFYGNKIVNNSLVSEKDMALVSGVPSDQTLVHVLYWFHPSNPQSMYANGANVVSGNKILSSQQSAGAATWGLGTWNAYSTLQASEWKSAAPTDTIVNRIAYRPLVTVLEGNLVPNADFDPALGGWNTYFDAAATGGSFTMGKFAACGTSNCGRHIQASANDQLRSGFFKMNATDGQNLHVFRMTAIGGDTDGIRTVGIRRFGSPWENYGLAIKSISVAAGKTVPVEQFFLAKYADDGVLDLRSSVGSTSYTRNVSVNRVKSIEFLNRAAVSTSVINPTATALSYPCVALKLSTCDAIDELGNKVSWPLVVPARSSVFVYAQDTKWKQ